MFYNWQRRLTPVHPPFEDTKKSLRSEDFLALRLFRFIRFIFFIRFITFMAGAKVLCVSFANWRDAV